MKRFVAALLLTGALLLSGCGAKEEPVVAETASPVAESIPPQNDLAHLSDTMAYAQLYNVAINPQQHIGQTFRLRGVYYATQMPETGEVVHLLLVRDQAACCEVALEFQAADARAYPQDFPANYSTIELVGVLGTIQAGEYTYPLLTVSDIQVLEGPNQPS